MSDTRSHSRNFWWAVAGLAVLLVAGYWAFMSGALAIWLDPEPEGELGTLVGVISPIRRPL